MTPLDFTRLRYVLGPVLQQQAALQQEGQVLDVLDALMPVIEAEVRALAPASLAAVQAVLAVCDEADRRYGSAGMAETRHVRAAIAAHFPDPAAPPVPTSPHPGGAAVPPAGCRSTDPHAPAVVECSCGFRRASLIRDDGSVDMCMESLPNINGVCVRPKGHVTPHRTAYGTSWSATNGGAE